MAREVAKVNKSQEKFLKKFWPGKVIIALKAKHKFPRGIVCRWGKIGLRIPNYQSLNQLLKQLNSPIAQTSANVSGRPASTKIQDVLEYFRGQKYQPDLVIDAGNLKKSQSSTVIDLTVSPPKILRR